MSNVKMVLSIIGSILLFVGVLFLITTCNIETEGYFRTKKANIERKVFKETTTYNEAKVQDLAKYRLEYMRAEDYEDKRNIASTIRIMFSDYDPDRFANKELGDFLRNIMNGGEI